MNLAEGSWKEKFILDVADKREELASIWENKWEVDCDGKKLFKSLQKRIQLGMPLLLFKKRIISTMRLSKSKLWLEINEKLVELIKS